MLLSVWLECVSGGTKSVLKFIHSPLLCYHSEFVLIRKVRAIRQVTDVLIRMYQFENGLRIGGDYSASPEKIENRIVTIKVESSRHQVN